MVALAGSCYMNPGLKFLTASVKSISP
eukprot:COSAG06_NODE_52121_length_307_cov_1.966346_1_plen_26_part_01